MGEYAIVIEFHHVHIPVSLDKFNQIFLKRPSICYQCIVHIKIQKSQKKANWPNVSTIQFNPLQKQSDIPSDKLATLKTQ